MSKIKNLFSNISSSIKETYKKFPITIIIIYFITAMYVFGTEELTDWIVKEGYLGILVVWAVGTFFVENCFTKKSFRIIGNVSALVISVIFKELLSSDTINNLNINRSFITYVSIIPILTIYKIIKNSKLEVKEYGLHLLFNLGKCIAIYILSFLGILLVLTIFIELILDGNDWDILWRTIILLAGGYYMPALINAFTDMSSEPGKFIRILVMYVFTPIVTFLIGILYIYVVKMLVNGELLHNAIFFILSLTFTGTMLVVLLLRNFEGPKVNKFSNILFYSFIPLLFLQIMAIHIRISDYGLTETRYLGCVLILFEIVFIILMIVKNSKYLDKIILFAAFLVYIIVLSPINAEKVSAFNQVRRIEKMFALSGGFDNLTDEEKTECQEIHRYLKRNNYKNIYENRLSEEDLNKIENYESTIKEELSYRDYSYIASYIDSDKLDISEFSTLYEIYGGDSFNYNYYNYPISDRKNEVNVNVNFNNFINKMAKAYEMGNVDEEFSENRLLDTDNENVKIYLINFNFTYDSYKKEVENFYFSGYILVK